MQGHILDGLGHGGGATTCALQAGWLDRRTLKRKGSWLEPRSPLSSGGPATRGFDAARGGGGHGGHAAGGACGRAGVGAAGWPAGVASRSATGVAVSRVMAREAMRPWCGWIPAAATSLKLRLRSLVERLQV